MQDKQDNNKRIAKNTVFLYLRMLITMAVGLYSSRVVLNTLGVSDFGVYSVMGGVIGMLGYINELLSGGTSRFITIDLGKGDIRQLTHTFSVTFTLALISSIIIIFLGETIGLWFMTTQLNIPDDRMFAAGIVYQCALISSALSILQTPFGATLIAHEKMGIFAYMSIYDVVMKLLVIYLLLLFNADKLILYSFLIFFVNVSSLLINFFYSKLHFEECNMNLVYDKKKYKEIFTYSGWNMIGTFSNMLNIYGINLILNIFFGTVINASRGIAVQVSNIVNQFSGSFQMASRPQITKYYAQNDIAAMMTLICNTSKFCSMLLLCLIIPISFNVEGFLMLWLGQIPDYTIIFVRLILLQIFLSAIDAPVGMGIMAVGKMRLPNLTTAFINMMVFPVTYVVLYLGGSPVSSCVVSLCATPFTLLTDLYILNKYTGIDVFLFIKKVTMPVLGIGLIACIVPLTVTIYFPSSSLLSTLIKSIICLVNTIIFVYYIGLTDGQKQLILAKLKIFSVKLTTS